MSTAEGWGMLDDDDLRNVDRRILDYLSEGRVTPVYCQRRLEDEGLRYSRAYAQQRLARLAEHDHVEKLMDTSLYELRHDPREEADE